MPEIRTSNVLDDIERSAKHLGKHQAQERLLDIGGVSATIMSIATSISAAVLRHADWIDDQEAIHVYIVSLISFLLMSAFCKMEHKRVQESIAHLQKHIHDLMPKVDYLAARYILDEQNASIDEFVLEENTGRDRNASHSTQPSWVSDLVANIGNTIITFIR